MPGTICSPSLVSVSLSLCLSVSLSLCCFLNCINGGFAHSALAFRPGSLDHDMCGGLGLFLDDNLYVRFAALINFGANQ